MSEEPLSVKRHMRFWRRHLAMLPAAYTRADEQRMTLAYFCLSALDLIESEDAALSDEERAAYRDWVYAQQLSASNGGGFRGSPVAKYSHLTMSYTALLVLCILRDDFARLDREALRIHVRGLQQADGSFCAAQGSRERDVRFSYCAIAIAYMLNDWDILDLDRAVAFLLSCQHYEGAFGQEPGLESHGGSTYCVIASLALAGRLGCVPRCAALKRWILQRQTCQGGFQGRVEKDADTCYSFWCGASAAILGCHGQINGAADVQWILSAESPMGGIAKVPGEFPDVLHSYLSYVALSLHVADQSAALPLAHVDAALNLSHASLAWLQTRLWQVQ